MSTIAYALRADYAGTVERINSFDAAGQPNDVETVPLFQGGVVSLDDTRDVNVAEELEAGGGIITVDETDTLAVIALDAYPPLKRVPAGEDAPLSVDQYADANVARLDAELKRRGIGGLGATKAAKVAALHADDARQAAGIPTPDPYTVEALVAADDTDSPEA